MSRRFDHAMKKSKLRRRRDLGKDLTLKTYVVLGNGDEVPVIGNREGGDGAASPDVDSATVSTMEWSGADLPLTLHSVPVGGKDKSAKIDEFGGITDRISKLLNDYDSLYAGDESSEHASQQSVAGQMYMDSLLSDYNTLCQEREILLESLQDSLDLDEEEVLDQLEKKAKESAAEMEGSQNSVMESFQTAKITFEKLKEINQNMVNMSKKGQDTGRLEQEKQQLEEELSMYKRMAVQQRMDNAYKSRRRASVVRKDETQQWKLVAGEMLNIVKGIKSEGQYDKDGLERELNNILMAMSVQNDTIEKLKIDLAQCEAKNVTLEQDKVKMYLEMASVQEDLDAKRQDNNQLKRVVNQLKNRRKQEAETAEVKAREQNELIVAQESDGRGTTPIANVQDTPPSNLLQAQLRDQKNKAVKFEAQNKELQQKIEEYEKEARKRRQQEMSLAQKAMKESGTNACSNCQVLGAQVINGRDEIVELDAKTSKLENELVSVHDQLKDLLEQHEKLKKSRKETPRKADKIPEIVTPSKTSAPEKTKAQPASADRTRSTSAKRTAKTKSAKESPQKLPALSPAPTSLQQVRKKIETKQEETEPEKTTPELSDDSEEQNENLLKPTTTTKVKPKKAQSSPKAAKKGKTSARAKKPEEITKKESEVAVEKTEEEVPEKLEDLIEKKKKEESLKDSKKVKDDELNSDEKAPYVKVREAKLMTLCDKGTQTGYHGRMATMNAVHRRESVGTWKAGKKHSLTDAIMSIAPPPVIEQELSVATNTIYEEVERLCEEISSFVEYGFDLVQQSGSTLHNQAERHIGTENTKEITKEAEHDILPAIERRLSVSHGGGGGGVGSRRRSSILQLDTRRGSIRNKEALFPAELLGRKRADTLPKLGEESGETSDENKQDESVNHVYEFQFKQNITNVAQQALDIIKGTGEVFSTQLNFKLGMYEKFYDLWRRSRQQRRQSIKVNVAGKGVLPSVSFEKPERPTKAMDHSEEDEDKMDVEPGSLFPHIVPSHGHVLHSNTNKGKPITTANLNNQGMMMIGSSSLKKPSATTEKQATAQTVPSKKRVKPLTRQQVMAKQKALLEKVLHVDSRMQDIRSIVMGAEQPLSFSRRASMSAPGGDSSFVAHGITGNEGQRQDKKADVQRKMSMIEEVEHSTSTWNASQPISKYNSSGEVPMEPPLVGRRRTKGQLPSLSLNISNVFK